MSHRMFLVQLDGLGSGEALFTWENDGYLVQAKVPRDEWEKADRPISVTVILADLLGARIDDAEALADAWSDGYKHGTADERRDDDMRAANPHWVKR